MATTAQLKTRIILGLNRDDMGTSAELEQALTDAIAEAVDNHADEQFWFNRKSGTQVTVASTATIALPSGMRCARAISYSQIPLTKVSLDQIEHLTETGQPNKWAENDGAIQLSPIPNAVYTLSLYGIADLGVPASASSNEWTTEGYALIWAAARLILCRDYLADDANAVRAEAAEEKALTKLRRETRKRGGVGLVADLAVPTAFNINTG
jgi:hypothetical protein